MSGPTSTYGPATTSGTVISYLPLVTAWSAPSQCSSLYLENYNSLYLNAPEYHSVVPGSPECVPPEVSSWWQNSINSASPTAILLGGYDFLCPEAYTTAFSMTTSSTTTIGCCPSDYDWVGTWYRAGFPNQCSSTIPAGKITFVQQDGVGSTYTTTSQSLSTPTVVWGLQVNGFLYPNPHTSASTTSGGGSSPTQTNGSSSNSSSTSSSKLSTGAIVGIVTGVVSMLATVGGLVFKIYKWKHPRDGKKQPAQDAEDEEPKYTPVTTSEIKPVERLCMNCGATTTTQFCTQCGARS